MNIKDHWLRMVAEYDDRQIYHTMTGHLLYNDTRLQRFKFNYVLRWLIDPRGTRY